MIQIECALLYSKVYIISLSNDGDQLWSRGSSHMTGSYMKHVQLLQLNGGIV